MSQQSVEQFLGAPVRVSPFIRFMRYSMLAAGILYGAKHYRTLTKRENDEQAYIDRMKPIWMEQKRQHMNKMAREELLYLAKETGTPVPASFDKDYPPPK